MFLLNGNPLNIDTAFSVETDVPYIIPAVIETNKRGKDTIVTPEQIGVNRDTVQYPANWLRHSSPEEREAIGIVEVPDPVRADDRFYWNGDVTMPKQLEDEIVIPEEGQDFASYEQKGLKSQWVAQIKQTAGSLLAQTDWMVIRKAERDVAIPADVVAYRAFVVTYAGQLETAINAAANMEDFIAVVTTQNWQPA